MSSSTRAAPGSSGRGRSSPTSSTPPDSSIWPAAKLCHRGSGTPHILDLGSGGGLPGLVIAIRWPAATLVLLDANERRTEFLQRAVRRCGLGERVAVVHQRAEVCGRDPEYRGTFDGVVVRSFGAPAVVAECGAPFLRQGGWLIVSEPPRASGEDGHRARWPAAGVAQVGLEPGEFVKAGFGYQVLYQREICPETVPPPERGSRKATPVLTDRACSTWNIAGRNPAHPAAMSGCPLRGRCQGVVSNVKGEGPADSGHRRDGSTREGQRVVAGCPFCASQWTRGASSSPARIGCICDGCVVQCAGAGVIRGKPGALSALAAEGCPRPPRMKCWSRSPLGNPLGDPGEERLIRRLHRARSLGCEVIRPGPPIGMRRAFDPPPTLGALSGGVDWLSQEGARRHWSAAHTPRARNPPRRRSARNVSRETGENP